MLIILGMIGEMVFTVVLTTMMYYLLFLLVMRS